MRAAKKAEAEREAKAAMHLKHVWAEHRHHAMTRVADQDTDIWVRWRCECGANVALNRHEFVRL